MKNGWVQENVMWVYRPLCPQESHVLRWVAGVTVGALARGRSRESREKMKNSPWGLSKSQAWARAHVWGHSWPSSPVASLSGEGESALPCFLGRPALGTQECSWGRQRACVWDGAQPVYLCICIHTDSCLDCGCSLTWNLHIISNPECTAHFKLLSPVKFCHMRWALSRTSYVSVLETCCPLGFWNHSRVIRRFRGGEAGSPSPCGLAQGPHWTCVTTEGNRVCGCPGNLWVCCCC